MYVCVGKSFVILNKTVKSAPLRREYVKKRNKITPSYLVKRFFRQREGQAKGPERETGLYFGGSV